ncbi:MAG: DNA polymerase III subunit gamma/tau [Candidatus Nomurabacteria bacterium]|jgi:DNA polymerase-3 subunit gamma/tau|nr:DNA polymerase III subunit gamma/tau [Candidatus Nomurabacteria bacterium]
MGKALYRKYRSKSLSEIIGQKHVTDILSAALKKGRVSHAYLFTGPRGVGKTSVARILAHEINELPYTEEDSHLDIIEIDAASNNGVDDIRNLREKVMIAPTSAKKKVYIIDEVHMLSKPAFNALLKTLEEPPEHVVFIMATTDAHKIPATIVSRSQQFTFRFISTEDAVKHLRTIADKESIKISDEALALIAKKGGGSFRDSISLLDQISSLLSDKEISKADAENALGLASEELVASLLTSHAAGNSSESIKILQQLLETGAKPETIAEQLMKYIIYDIDTNLHLLSLLDKLPEVARSSYPEVKLLTILAGLPPVVPTANSSRNSAQPLKIGNPAPSVRTMPISNQVERSGSSQSSETTGDKSNHSEERDELGGESEPETNTSSGRSAFAEGKNVRLEGQNSTSEGGTVFSWDALLEDIKENRPAIYTILSKCGHKLNGDELEVYAKNKLWKNKLDTAAFRKRVADAGGTNLEVTVLAKAAPTGNGAVDTVADIMGGGEEVELDAE